eukprot:8518122-Ditylum_brightwellii.AAC.1
MSLVNCYESYTLVPTANDFSMKALLCHSYDDCQTKEENFVWLQAPSKDGRLGAKLHDTCKLPLNVPGPKLLADPTHRIKVVAKPFFGMKTKGNIIQISLETECNNGTKHKAKQYYHIKERHGKMYVQMKELFSEFTSRKHLEECHH